MKYRLWIFIAHISLAAWSLAAEPVKIPQKSVPGIKLNYNNTALIESLIRQKVSTRANTDKITIKFECYKHWKVRGRNDLKSYQCEPIEVEAEVPAN
jgi:hypothetical protein